MKPRDVSHEVVESVSGNAARAVEIDAAQALHDVNNWDRQYLKKADMPDRHLMDCMLKAHPRKLPEVHMVDKHNVEEISRTSETYRSKIMPK